MSNDANGSLLKGGQGDDILGGRCGNNTIQGNGGNNLIQGDKGADILSGSAGFDIFLNLQIIYHSRATGIYLQFPTAPQEPRYPEIRLEVLIS
ncbi:MAG: hypothetical protein EXR08_08375 [Alphaproteobacteria bacterium]|nr:hypothetical protein [Alphaproteobacteria bacterium]